MAFIKVYTREAIGIPYPSALAQSVHLSLGLNGEDFLPLNDNFGVLFPKAEIGELNNILERGALNPTVAKHEGRYYIYADFVDANGTEVYPDLCWAWKTDDFIDFCEVGLINKCERALGTDTIEITDKLILNIINEYSPLHFVKAELTHETVGSIEELKTVKAICTYSDGSTDIKPIKWNLDNVAESQSFEVTGEILQPKFPYPCIRGFADPVVYKWDGKWHFLSTNDNTGDVGLFVCSADTVEGLFAEDNYPKCILPYNEEKGHVQTFWAPEFHKIGDDLYILFALGGKQWSPQCHYMKLKKGGTITDPDSWEDPVRFKKADGTNLVRLQITLDMTHFEARGRHYVAWSERTFHPADSGSMIFIGEIDPKNPGQLISEPVLIARPLYGWENQSGTVNNEGPYPLIVGDKIYLAFSGGSAGGYSYTVGYLIADMDADLLNASSWKKTMNPVLATHHLTDCEGPGHNSFYVGDDGKTMIAYHAEPIGYENRRCTHIHRVHFNAKGFPVVGMNADRDLPEDKKDVKITVKL